MRGRISGWMRQSAVVMLIGVWSFSLLAQGLPTQSKQVMQRKLEASQQLLAALVTSNWVALDRGSRALKALTDDPGWDGETRRVDAAFLAEHVEGELNESAFMVAGPPAMAEGVQQALTDAGVAEENVIAQRFSGY